MKLISKSICLLGLAFLLVQAHAQEKKYAYAPSFRYCPDRDYDLAWENDLVAFRVYGLQPSPNDGLSGVDAWHKRISYPIVDKWYRGNLEGISYHQDHGEGCDQYHVGKTRGVGGVGIWKNNEILRSGLYESWEVISLTQTTLKFKLTYSWNIDGERIVETRVITLENGSQLYAAESHFTKNGFPVSDIEIAVGLSTQNGIAEVTINKEKGWMSAWHPLGDGQGMIGVGAIVDTGALQDMLDQRSERKDDSNLIAVVKPDVNGCVRWKAGFAWEKAGVITTKADWNSYLDTY